MSKQSRFAPYLLDKFEIVKQQAEAGQYVLKRFAYFVEKVSALQRNCAKEIKKIAAHEKDKEDKAQKDGMRPHLDAYKTVQAIVSSQADQQLAYADAIDMGLVEPITAYYKKADKKREDCIKQEAKLLSQLEKVTSTVQKSRANCLSLWKDLQAAKKKQLENESKGMAGAKNVPALEKAFGQAKEKCAKAFIAFEDQLKASVLEQQQIFEKDFPALADQFERMEEERLDVMNEHMKHFVKLQENMAPALQDNIKMISSAVSKLDTDSEVMEWVQSNVKTHGLPLPVPLFKIGLPCSGKLIEQSNQNFYEVLSQDTAYAIMAYQKQCEPNGEPMTRLPQAPGAKASPKPQSAPAASAQASSPVVQPTPAVQSTQSSTAPKGPSKLAAALGVDKEMDDDGASSAASGSAPTFNLAAEIQADKQASFVQAQFEFVPRAAGDDDEDTSEDLAFQQGDLLFVVAKKQAHPDDSEVEDDGDDDMWWRGFHTTLNGRNLHGIFPSNYVKEIFPDPASSEASVLMLIPSFRKLIGWYLKSAAPVDAWTAAEGLRTAYQAASRKPDDKTRLERAVNAAKSVEKSLKVLEKTSHKVACISALCDGKLAQCFSAASSFSRGEDLLKQLHQQLNDNVFTPALEPLTQCQYWEPLVAAYAKRTAEIDAAASAAE
jgi:hypothetical protein